MSNDKDVTVKALCTQCHSFDMDAVAVKHGAVENQRSCLNCHNPHTSKNTKLLKLPVKDLCLSCHDKPIQATLSDARTIPNIKAKVDSTRSNMASCTYCHTAHGSSNSRILSMNFSTTNYNEYPAVGKAANPYALCMDCHDGILDKDNTDTNFRTPVKNLHWKHVVEEQPGKSCRICHDVHGTKNPFSINDSWSMNGTPIGINFTKTDNGGNCTMTCHDIRTYSRQ
jgi:predicted CXXCH cytochrome family protein